MRNRATLSFVIACSLVGMGACKKQAPAEPPAAEAPTPAIEAPKPEPKPEPVREAPANITVKDVGLMTPESVLHDTDADVYLVSNINGAPVAADGNGFISRITPDGTVEELKWIDGDKEGVTLNAPKGMGIADGVLYVTDINFVRKFDAKTGEPKGEIEIEGATFLNDVAVGPDGAVYVSDTGVKGEKLEPSGADAVYRIEEEGAEALARGSDLNRPNGLWVDDKGLWVVTFGSNELYRIEDGKKVDVKTLPKGSLDGIVKDSQGHFVIASWEGKEVMRGIAEGPFATVIANAQAPADIGYDLKRKRLLVPRFMDDMVQIVGM